MFGRQKAREYWTEQQKLDWLAAASYSSIFPGQFRDDTERSLCMLLARKCRQLEKRIEELEKA
jgi:hypothetical protein